MTGLYPLDNKIATIEFTYKPNLRMDDQNRIENPLGFQVTGYRVDNDYGSLPPAEATNPAASQAQAITLLEANNIPPSPIPPDSQHTTQPRTADAAAASPATSPAARSENRNSANGGHR